jgi:hypothetical protein
MKPKLKNSVLLLIAFCIAVGIAQAQSPKKHAKAVVHLSEEDRKAQLRATLDWIKSKMGENYMNTEDFFSDNGNTYTGKTYYTLSYVYDNPTLIKLEEFWKSPQVEEEKFISFSVVFIDLKDVFDIRLEKSYSYDQDSKHHDFNESEFILYSFNNQRLFSQTNNSNKTTLEFSCSAYFDRYVELNRMKNAWNTAIKLAGGGKAVNKELF